jgi:hypothetical protein
MSRVWLRVDALQKNLGGSLTLHCKQTIQKIQFIGSFGPHSVLSLAIGHHCVQHEKQEIKRINKLISSDMENFLHSWWTEL